MMGRMYRTARTCATALMLFAPGLALAHGPIFSFNPAGTRSRL